MSVLRPHHTLPVLGAVGRGQTETDIPVQFGLTLGPFDGSFQALAEEALKREVAEVKQGA